MTVDENFMVKNGIKRNINVSVKDQQNIMHSKKIMLKILAYEPRSVMKIAELIKTLEIALASKFLLYFSWFNFSNPTVKYFFFGTRLKKKTKTKTKTKNKKKLPKRKISYTNLKKQFFTLQKVSYVYALLDMFWIWLHYFGLAKYCYKSAGMF